MVSFSPKFHEIILVVSLFATFTTVACTNRYKAYASSHFGNISRSESFAPAKTHTAPKNTVAYIKASTPVEIFKCTQTFSLLRCLKLFLLQRMSNLQAIPKSGNITKDFLEQIMHRDRNYPSLLDKKYMRIGDNQLSDMLKECFQRFFKDREIKLHFIPGVMVRVVPSKENRIRLSLRRSLSEGRKHKPFKSMVQLAVPVMMMPAVLLGTVLPFVLPALKMATIISTLINSGAFIAALLFAARTAAGNTEEHLVHYTHPGYH